MKTIMTYFAVKGYLRDALQEHFGAKTHDKKLRTRKVHILAKIKRMKNIYCS